MLCFSRKSGRVIAELILEGIFVECKIWEESAVITASVDSVQMLNPLNKQVTLLMRRVCIFVCHLYVFLIKFVCEEFQAWPNEFCSMLWYFGITTK